MKEMTSWLIENCGFVNPFCVRNTFLPSMRTMPESNIDWLWDNDDADDDDNSSGTRNEKNWFNTQTTAKSTIPTQKLVSSTKFFFSMKASAENVPSQIYCHSNSHTKKEYARQRKSKDKIAWLQCRLLTRFILLRLLDRYLCRRIICLSNVLFVCSCLRRPVKPNFALNNLYSFLITFTSFDTRSTRHE